MHTKFTTTPSTTYINFLTKKLNQEVPEYGESYPFGFFKQDDNAETIAGCNGWVVFGAIYTDQLWVHPHYRKNGLGRDLLERVHNYGREIGCTMSTVATMSFQLAQDFYKKLGYVVEYERRGHLNNSSLILLKKDL